MTLRNCILAICGVLLVLAFAQFITGWASGSVIAVEVAIVVALILFERGRYRPKVSGSSDRFLRTGERFEDPTTGEKMEVYADPKTGERDYRKI